MKLTAAATSIAAACILSAACGSSPTAPTPAQPTTPQPVCTVVHHPQECHTEVGIGGVGIVCKPAYDETVCE